MVFINLRDISDEAIRGMKDALLLRNILLVFKHIKEGNFFKLNFSEVVIFADENVPQEMLVYLFDVTLYYIQVASPIKIKDVMEISEALPQPYGQRVKSAYEQFVELGMEKGMEKGREKGREELLLAYIKKNPKMTDREIADLFDVPTALIKKVRASIAAA